MHQAKRFVLLQLKQYSESQFNMIPAFEIMAPRRSISGLIEEKAYRNGIVFICSILSSTDMKKETKTVPFPARSPQRFGHKEIEKATNGFSTKNFLAEGGYGHVYIGVLSGQVVAVKKRKMVSAQEFGHVDWLLH
ncbi:inactive protein kinase [Tanacetum coccineum]|uniref:non-specific serine/threonine protein kinase n=1 Tax=Tanacetum coccineum TaxID=301880 RepID=A0ABQ4XHT5_9ASTR